MILNPARRKCASPSSAAPRRRPSDHEHLVVVARLALRLVLILVVAVDKIVLEVVAAGAHGASGRCHIDAGGRTRAAEALGGGGPLRGVGVQRFERLELRRHCVGRTPAMRRAGSPGFSVRASVQQLRAASRGPTSTRSATPLCSQCANFCPGVYLWPASSSTRRPAERKASSTSLHTESTRAICCAWPFQKMGTTTTSGAAAFCFFASTCRERRSLLRSALPSAFRFSNLRRSFGGRFFFAFANSPPPSRAASALRRCCRWCSRRASSSALGGGAAGFGGASATADAAFTFFGGGASVDAAARFSAFGGPSRGAFTFFLAFAGTSAGIAAALRVRCGCVDVDVGSARSSRARRGM